MKKIINLLVVFICVFALASCSMPKKSDAASHKELLNFLKQKDLYSVTDSEYDYKITEKKYEYEFTVNKHIKEKNQHTYSSSKTKLKGQAILEIKEDDSYLEYYMKGNQTVILKFPIISGNISAKDTIKEEIYGTLTSDSTYLYYLNQKETIKSQYRKKITDMKVKSSNNLGRLNELIPDFIGYLEELLDSDDAYGFVNDKKCTIIFTDISEKRIIEMWFDGDEIIKLKETVEYHDGKDVTVLKFKDVDSIGKPKNSSDYENIDKNDNDI